MKLFKNVDDKFKELGFKKIRDNDLTVTYERENKKYKYTQVLEILHKGIVQSYDKNLIDKDEIGNCVVGLTYYEMELCLKKAKKKGWY